MNANRIEVKVELFLVEAELFMLEFEIAHPFLLIPLTVPTDMN